MVTNVQEIMEKAVVDHKIGTILQNYPYPFVSCMSFKYEPSIPPAFTFGFSVFGFSFGGIYISDLILNNFQDKELEWIILHELAHIVNNHLGLQLLFDYISYVGAEFFAETLDISFSNAELLVKLIRAYFTITSGGITREFELGADKWASDYQGTNKHGISVLRKMYGENIDVVSHVSKGFTFEVPALTVRQRIEALQKNHYYV